MAAHCRYLFFFPFRPVFVTVNLQKEPEYLFDFFIEHLQEMNEAWKKGRPWVIPEAFFKSDRYERDSIF
ncbi:hypothetical protein A6M21_13605 [Desulfotomaculum copahuensis]|uniref:Uncharacterized protein n=1 Tax=Desulfotomaculum copahuensis TaxID=1838280 RepID=A0A1B7LCB9_9FIRM|nr:hypothetical protein A6M21_13605 [Desulfotomaculum copahuensis]